MKQKRKYEILAFIWGAFLCSIGPYYSIIEYKKPIESFKSTSGEVQTVEVIKLPSTVVTSKGPLFLKSKVIVIDIDKDNKFLIFKPKIKQLLSSISQGDFIDIKHKNYSTIDNQELNEVVEVIKNKQVIYSYNNWIEKEFVFIIIQVLAALSFLIVGIKRHSNYLKYTANKI